MTDQYENPYIHPKFTRHINNNDVNAIIELGVRDGLFTKTLNDFYNPKKIISIEANPFLIDSIKNNQKELDNVELFNIALFDKDSEISFFLHEDGGSSSIYDHPFAHTKEIKVKCTTLDNFCNKNNFNKIDLICADVEGAEAAIFKNSKILRKCKYIITEVKFDQFFKGKNFPNIKNMEDSLIPLGFSMKEILVRPNYPFGDSLWINEHC